MRRGRYEIMSDILSAAKEPSTKTRVVYKANLSFSQAERYLEFLLGNELLKEIDESNTKYKITDKGKKFLENYEDLEELLLSESKIK